MRLKGMRVAILAENLYQELEVWYPLLRLREEGAEVFIVAPKKGAVYKSKLGYPIESTLAASAVDVEKIDAVIVPGGYAPDLMRRYPEMVRIVREAHQKGKVVAAICHAGWMLVSAGILNGKRVTGFFSIKDGSRGAHVNISGIAGVATKTSYATFLLHSLFTSGALGGEAANTHALVFNVKGEDLLFLDQANGRLREEDRAAYARLGLPAEAFSSTQLLAPVRKGSAERLPATGSRGTGVQAFFWTIREVVTERLLRFLFAEAEDAASQLGFVVDKIEAKLAAAAAGRGDAKDPWIEVEGRTLDFELNDPADPEGIYYRSDHYSYAAKGIPVACYTTGLHPDYHTNDDEVDRINFEKMTRIAQLVYETAWRVANLDHPPVRDNKGPRAGKGASGKLTR